MTRREITFFDQVMAWGLGILVFRLVARRVPELGVERMERVPDAVSCASVGLGLVLIAMGLRGAARAFLAGLEAMPAGTFAAPVAGGFLLYAPVLAEVALRGLA